MVTERSGRERPILFSAQMVRAILDGRKSQTRRVVKSLRTCYGRAGDRLWVRETWQSGEYAQNDPPGYVYRATDPDWETTPGWKWRPSIFMPREASRITLEVCDVRVERVQDITPEDARAEGIPQTGGEAHALGLIDLSKEPDYLWVNRTSVENYARLWDHINAKRGYGWSTNPWVWVVTFRVLR